ncbi:hypothetical protein CYMTET_37975 [Cymbomonas tetramitiformis]|uniref:Uncharacterized protein n=1 Tax=Cymbomonas tetramitiformis TaxID=36881 RepID=A0AAE0CF70_9CHLO|nr:hypothetical protein CYMTET_37975 [Cymbomonas tetramitiformis]|eukprot:gene20019-23959_t
MDLEQTNQKTWYPLRIEAECSYLSHSVDERVAKWRSKEGVKIYCGDFKLRVEVEPTGAEIIFGDSINRRAAFADLRMRDLLRHRQLNDNELCLEYSSGKKTAAEVFFEASNFGELFWDWVDCSPELSGAKRRGVYGIDADTGKKFLPRIWQELSSEAGESEIVAAEEQALNDLNELPAVLKDGIPKARMAERIRHDLKLLRELVADAGTFGKAILGPDAHQKIIFMNFASSDGNYRHFVFSTEANSYDVSVHTS